MKVAVGKQVLFLAFLLFVSAGAHAAPGYGEPLDVTTGTVYAVSTLAELKNAVDSANAAGVPATILVADGEYVLDVQTLQLRCPGLIIRGASGNRDNVIIRGPDEGTNAALLHVFYVPTNDVTIADMSFGYCRWHGVQVLGHSPYDVSGLRVHNCRIVNCNEQFIKGTSDPADPVGATDGIVESCLFEFTSGWAYQYYTGGIDVHKGVNWVVRDNLFRNIRNNGAGLAEHAVHFWNRCPVLPQNITVERNWVINCDRGIGFGLGSYDGGHNGGSSVIRNNMVYNNGTGPNTDVCIGLEHACDVLVDNNTVYNETYGTPIEYRFSTSSNIVFRNNLVDKAIKNRDSAPPAVMSNNIESVQASWFKGLGAGDLRLVYGVTAAIDQGCTVPGFADDVDGETRPKLGGWDVGADEYDPATADSDGDTMTDKWEVDRGLNPTNSVGADGADGNPDGDPHLNWQEYVADTHPQDEHDYFCISTTLVDRTNGFIISWPSVSNRVYTMVTVSNAVYGFTNDPSFTNVPGTGKSMSYTNDRPEGSWFYRLIVKLRSRRK